MGSVNTIHTGTMDNIRTLTKLARRTTTSTLTTTTLPPTAVPHTDPGFHVFLTLGLVILFGILVVGFAAVGLVVKTRWDRYRLHMMPLYQFDQDQEDLEAELLDSPEREPVSGLHGKTRRDFGTC